MGANDRNAKSLRRRGPARDSYDRVLIVCEGSKSEPDYFRALAQDLKLGSAQVVVTGDSDSAPIKVVEKAIKRFQQDRDFDQVYCIFDRDQHDTYRAALERVASETLTIRPAPGFRCRFGRCGRLRGNSCAMPSIVFHGLARFWETHPTRVLCLLRQIRRAWNVARVGDLL